MNTEVKVMLKRAYGREMFEARNETAKLLCELVGAKNLTLEQLRTLRKLGYTIVNEAPPIEGLED